MFEYMSWWPGRSNEISKRINNEIKKEHQLQARQLSKKERKSIVDKLNPFRITNQEHYLRKLMCEELIKEKRTKEKEMTLLLLGSSCSGKSTIAKQMRVIHSFGFPQYERKSSRQVVYFNVITAVQTLITASMNMGFMLLPSNKEAAGRLLKLAVDATDIAPQDLSNIASLWIDPAIQQAFLRGHKLHLYGYEFNFFNDIARISSPDYVPSQQDIFIFERQLGYLKLDLK